MPTSDLIKFKAKGWIDVFGARFAKAVGELQVLLLNVIALNGDTHDLFE